MPVFDITDPQTGRQFTIEGDSEPDEQELEEIFGGQAAQVPQPAQEPLELPPGFTPSPISSRGLTPSGVSTIAGGSPTRNALVGTPDAWNWQNLRGPTPNPARAAAEALIGTSSDLQPEDSAIGISPERVMTGEQMTEASGVPKALTVPLSAGVKAVAGLGQFLTSPEGAIKTGVAAIPGVGLLQRAEFIADMSKGSGEIAGELSTEIENAARNPQQVDNSTWQRIAEHTANEALMLYGAGKMSAHEFSRVTGVRAPLGRFTESERTRLAKDLAQELLKSELSPQQRTPIPQRELGVRIPEGEFAQPGIPELADAALRERQQRIAVPGQEDLALNALRRAIEPPQIIPETRAIAERPGGGEARFGKTSYRRGAEDVSRAADERQQFEPEQPTEARGELQTVVRQQPLRTSEELLRERLAKRDFVAAVDAISKLPAEAQVKAVNEVIGVGRKKVPLSAAERTIFNEVWDKVYQESLGKGKEPAASPQKVPDKVEQWFDDAIKKTEFGTDWQKKTSMGVAQIPVWLTQEAATLALKAAKLTYTTGRDVYAAIADGIRVLKENPGFNAAEAESWMRRQMGDVLPKDIAEKSGNLRFDKEIQSPSGASKWQFTILDKSGKEQTTFGIDSGASKEAIQRRAGTRRIQQERGIEEIAEAEKIHDSEFREQQIKNSIAPQKNHRLVEVVRPDGSTYIAEFGDKYWDWPGAGKVASIGIEKNGDWSHGMTKPGEVIREIETAKPEVATATGDMVSRLESLKFSEAGEGRLYSLPHPDAIAQIGKTAWNNAIDLAIVGVKAGKVIGEAINEAIAYIKKNASGFDETKLRDNLNSILGKEFPSGKPERTEVELGSAKGSGTSTIPAAAKPDSKGGTLDDIYKIFEPKPKATTPLKQQAANLIESVRTGLSSKFRPINKLAEDIAKAYGRTSSKDIAGIMEQLKGSQGKGEAEIYRFDRDVSKLVEGSEKDFNAYLFLRRAIDRLDQDAKDIETAKAGGDVKTLNRRAVADYTLNELRPKLEVLKEKLGEEKLQKFQDAAERYQAYMDDALRLQVESGRMSTEVYEAIKNGNQFYAPFKVMKWIEETSRPEGTSQKPIDTRAAFTKAMEGIEDKNFKLGDMLGAARQNILLSRILADKNMAMRHVAELSVFDTEGRFIKKLAAGAEAPRGMEAVNVLEGGKQNRYAVAPEVAEAIKLYGGNAGGIITRMLSASSIPFRAGATALNLPFQISNLLADVPRQALVSKYGVRGVNDLVRYPMDFIHSLYSSIAGDVFGRDNKLFLDFLDSGVAGTTVQEFLTPEALRFKEPTNISKSRRLAGTVVNTIPQFAKAIEQTSKVMGVKRAMRFEGVESGKELARQIPEAITELRRFSGSPDFGRQGKFVEQARLNLLYMFLNARIQGVVADVGRLTGRDGAKTAASTWLKVGAAIGIPTAYLYYINHLPQYKDDYEKRSKQEKQNYWLIPKDSFITTEDGEKMRDYWRIPKREVSKWFANATESALNFAQERDPESALDFGKLMVQEISPINVQGNTPQERLESVASGLNPLLKAPLEFATGRDLYRHRDLMSDQLKKASPENQFNDRTAEAFKKLAVAMPDVSPEFLRSPIVLENLTRNLTAGLLTQFLPRKPVQGRTGLENEALLQRFQALPYRDNPEFKEQLQQLEREAADEQLTRHRTAVKLLDENKGQTLEMIVKKTGGDVRLIKHLADLWISKENGSTFNDRQLLALPARQRAAYVASQLKGLSGDNKEKMVQELARKRILTEAVLAELPEFMQK